MNLADRFTSESVAAGHPDKMADQTAFRHEDGKPVGVAAVGRSTQHRPDGSLKKPTEGVMVDIITPILPKRWLAGSGGAAHTTKNKTAVPA